MNRIDEILKHHLFIRHLKLNEEAEADRRFCRHNMGHFLDVARIAMILNEKEHIGVPQEWIYAAGLLHDIGRHVQYETGIPHEQASAEIAPDILRDCGFNEEETRVIVEAISCHRNAEVTEKKDLSGILYRADKASRACFACEAEPECNWKDGKKNLKLRY